MKSILMSIKPKYVSMILNKVKTIEVRKRFPSDYVGWVYIYCTKTKPRAILTDKGVVVANTLTVGGNSQYKSGYSLSGKVVARFWCDKVDDYVNGHNWSWKSGSTMWGACNDYEYILKDACLTEDELYDYCEDLSFKAIHITKLEIFDKPKEISNFEIRATEGDVKFNNIKGKMLAYKPLSRAPQSWCYIEL